MNYSPYPVLLNTETNVTVHTNDSECTQPVPMIPLRTNATDGNTIYANLMMTQRIAPIKMQEKRSYRVVL